MKNLAFLPVAFVGIVACGPAETPPPSMPDSNVKAVEDPPAPKTPKVSAPSALALSCKTDDECQGHKCNVPLGKCSYPCASDVDCTNGGTCQANGAPGMAVCVTARHR